MVVQNDDAGGDHLEEHDEVPDVVAEAEEVVRRVLVRQLPCWCDLLRKVARGVRLGQGLSARSGPPGMLPRPNKYLYMDLQ